MAQVYKHDILRSKIKISTRFGLRKFVIQISFERKCATFIVERVTNKAQPTMTGTTYNSGTRDGGVIGRVSLIIGLWRYFVNWAAFH